MKLNFTQFSIEKFLSDYWQQKPVVIKGGIKNFHNPVEPDELAGLAAEPNIESRLIYQSDQQWHADSGPFEHYQKYGQTHWTLVVQSVNHWIPEVQEFARLFDFIPQWRLDDVMVSFASPQGGVGPHVDNYDVFICQGSGKRRWRVGGKGEGEKIIAHEKLLHVSNFDAIIDEEIEAGDILYIPPGFPHEGISLDTSMSFSVGYKSVNSTELLSGFADYLIDFDKEASLLSDKERTINRYGEITDNDVSLLQNLLLNTLKNKEKLRDFLGLYYSQSLSELDLAEDEYNFPDWLSLFKQTPLIKLHAVKALYLPNSIEKGIFYFDGERQKLDAEVEMLKYLCDTSQLVFSNVNNEAILHWLWQYTNRGYFYFQ